MNLKNLLKIILFVAISGFLLIFLSGCKHSTVNTFSKLEVDTSYNDKLESINKILEKNEEYENADAIVKKVKLDTYSYTLNAHCKENNDTKMMRAKNKRVSEIESKTDGKFMKW